MVVRCGGRELWQRVSVAEVFWLVWAGPMQMGLAQLGCILVSFALAWDESGLVQTLGVVWVLLVSC